jgi:type III secretory pathway lipoprotein EscJ
MRKLIIFGVAATFALASCKKTLEDKFDQSQNNNQTVVVEKMSEIKVPVNFNDNRCPFLGIYAPCYHL